MWGRPCCGGWKAEGKAGRKAAGDGHQLLLGPLSMPMAEDNTLGHTHWDTGTHWGYTGYTGGHWETQTHTQRRKPLKAYQSKLEITAEVDKKARGEE